MAAVLTRGETILDGAACEPEIVDLCNMLQKMGAQIIGAGSHLIKIHGVDRLNGCNHRVIPDRIEAATYIMSAAVTRGKIKLNGVDPAHLGAFTKVMRDSGIFIEKILQARSCPCSSSSSKLSPFEIITLPYPGFPTDLQAQACLVHHSLTEYFDRTSLSQPFHVYTRVVSYGSRSFFRGCQRDRMAENHNGAPVMASDLRASGL